MIFLMFRVILGRTHIRTVADERRAELELFLQELLKLASEISECDLIYTFFHPMLKGWAGCWQDQPPETQRLVVAANL